MPGRLQGWLALSGPERRRFIGLLFALPMIHASLAVAGYVRTLRLLERISRHPNPHTATEVELAAAERLAELSDIAGRRGVISATCLRQSLLIHTLLRRRGLRPELKLGVRKQGAETKAHAWVELEGRALAEANIGFAPLLRSA